MVVPTVRAVFSHRCKGCQRMWYPHHIWSRCVAMAIDSTVGSEGRVLIVGLLSGTTTVAEPDSELDSEKELPKMG